MKVRDKHWHALWPLEDGSGIGIIDQRLLPHEFITEELRSFESVLRAITEMHLRGAPLIGAAAAWGMWFAAMEAEESRLDDQLAAAARKLKESRPTAVNLAWAVERQLEKLVRVQSIADVRAAARATAEEIVADELERSKRIAEFGLEIIQKASRTRRRPLNILTHCNAGWLASIDYGTATAPIYRAHELGIELHVWVDETRPRNQGSSLTAWELREQGVPHTIIVDNAGGQLMQEGLVDLVIVGADRVTGTGDVANKIGTYLKALAAWDNRIPFYVAVPTSSIDPSLQKGGEIPIERRTPDEVLFIEGFADGKIQRVRIAPEGSPALNPAFDITPARLVTGLITERGVCKAARPAIRELLGHA